MEANVGALAIFTIGGAFLIGAFLLLRHNRDPHNREITKAVVAGDSSTHTAVRGGDKPDHMK